MNDADPIEALRARVCALEDADAIRKLKARYAELVDARYERGAPKSGDALGRLADEIAALFTEDAVWEGGALGTQTGRVAIRERMAQPTLSSSRHYFVNPQIDVAGDRATARWELLAPCNAADGKPMWMAGVEDDAYARVGAVWLHTRMKLAVHFFAPHERGWTFKR